MATTISTTYAGEFKEKYIAAALLSGKTLDNGGMTVLPNIAFKEVLQKSVMGSDFIVNATCDYADAGTLTLSERILEVEEFQVNKTECKKTFAQTWQSAEMGYSVMNQELPKSFADFIVQQYIAKIAEKTEQNVWQGVNATAGEFDGITTIAAANAGSLAGGAAVTGTTVTASNVVTELGKVVDNVAANSPAILDKEDLRIYVGNGIFQAYIRSLGGFALTGSAGTNDRMTQWYDGGGLSFDGVKIFLAPGMPANQMVCAQISNLYFGCGILGDLSELRLIDTSETLGDQNVRFVARWKAGVQIGILGEVTYYA